jgi:hypothetical protein
MWNKCVVLALITAACYNGLSSFFELADCQRSCAIAIQASTESGQDASWNVADTEESAPSDELLLLKNIFHWQAADVAGSNRFVFLSVTDAESLLAAPTLQSQSILLRV